MVRMRLQSEKGGGTPQALERGNNARRTAVPTDPSDGLIRKARPTHPGRKILFSDLQHHRQQLPSSSKLMAREAIQQESTESRAEIRHVAVERGEVSEYEVLQKPSLIFKTIRFLPLLARLRGRRPTFLTTGYVKQQFLKLADVRKGTSKHRKNSTKIEHAPKHQRAVERS